MRDEQDRDMALGRLIDRQRLRIEQVHIHLGLLAPRSFDARRASREFSRMVAALRLLESVGQSRMRRPRAALSNLRYLH
jgi:hypothetical protein